MKIRCVVACLMAMAVSTHALAGDLNPPAGAVSETGRFGPRIEVNDANTPGDINSLFKITKPGSYYLGGNLAGVSGKHGVVIASSGVTLDLMGFELLGAVNSIDGINVSGSATNIHIHNGSIRGWGGDGIDAIVASNSSVRGLLVHGNGGQGIILGPGALVEDCAAQSNGFGFGFNIQDNSTITRCTAQNNTGGGFRAAKYCSVSQCNSNGNTFDGFFVGAGSTVSECTATANSFDGLQVDDYCTVTACAAALNGADGIKVDGGSVIIGCASGQNGLSGFHVGSFSIITQCSALNNTGDGIRAFGAVQVIENSCHFNGSGNGDGAGIHATSTDCRIEGNNVSFNDRGIDIDVGGNLIMRNSAASNGINYAIVVNNKVGIIVFAPSSAAINGLTGGAGVGTTDPWANFSY